MDNRLKSSNMPLTASKETLDLLETAIENSEYDTFLKKYYPAANLYNAPETKETKQYPKTRPVLKLNPFKKLAGELGGQPQNMDPLISLGEQ